MYFITTEYRDKVRLAEWMRWMFHRFFLLLTTNMMTPPTPLHTTMGGVKITPNLGSKYISNLVKLWNPEVWHLSSIKILLMSRFCDIDKEGAAQVIVKFFVNIGILEERRSHLSLCPNTYNNVIFIFGDYLLMDHIASLLKKLLKSLCGLDLMERTKFILSAIKLLRTALGDLHIPFHMLHTTYRFFYRGIIQPIQITRHLKNTPSVSLA